MATMKTIEDLQIVQDTLRIIERKHRWDRISGDISHVACQVGLCIKCGEIVFSCEPGWAERQCGCDAPEVEDLTEWRQSYEY